MNTNTHSIKLFVITSTLLSIAGCAGRPTVHLNRTPDALYDTLRESASIKEEESHLEREENCYRKYSYNQMKYDDCLSRPKQRIRPDRYKQRDPMITLPDWQQKDGKIINIR